MKKLFRRSKEKQHQEEEENTIEQPDSSPFQDHSDQRYVEISQNLYMAIVKIQANQNISDWKRACDRAAVLLGESTKKFDNLVANEARKRYNGLFMQQLNEAKKTIEKNVREKEDNFRVQCGKCGQPMHFSSSDGNWEQSKEILNKAFESWTHVKCVEKSKMSEG
jgi:hypothetical protein